MDDLCDQSIHLKKSFRLKCHWNNKCFIYRLLIVVLITFLLLFRGHFWCLCGFLNCYLTWPFISPRHVQIDFVHLSVDDSSIEYIPRRIHHILLGPLSESPPLNWQLARNSCLILHSHYEKHFFWTNENSEEFLSKHYQWFVKTWKSYETLIQKADSLRYFVLFHYGGIFLDMDLSCRHRLDSLLNYLDQRISPSQQMFFAVKAFPVGISNGFMISTIRHPLLEHVIHNLEYYHRSFILPHATIVISTGPMCISIQIQLNRSIWNSILVLDGKENMLGGKTETPLFKHLGSGSWHQADETFFKNIPLQIQHQTQTFSISILFLFTLILTILFVKNKSFVKVNSHSFVRFSFTNHFSTHSTVSFFILDISTANHLIDFNFIVDFFFHLFISTQ